MATKQDFGNTDIENIDKLLKFNNINIKKDVAKVLPKCCQSVAKVLPCCQSCKVWYNNPKLGYFGNKNAVLATMATLWQQKK